MVKLSKAEKMRRKEQAILHHSEHLLNIIWACRDDAVYNRVKWEWKDQLMWIRSWSAFVDGCRLADGLKWYNRLQKQWADYEAAHGKCVKG